MKKKLLVFALILFSITAFSQKKEKLKGSKKVTLEQKIVGDFDALEVFDDLQIFLVKSDKCSIEIEADDNIHEALGITLNGKTLQLNMAKNISSYKKFQVRVNYTTDFRTIISRQDSEINALATIELDEVTFKTFDYSKLTLNAKTKTFTLLANDKTRAEINLKSDNSIVELSKGSRAKFLISSSTLKMDMYQNAEVELEGDANQMKLRMDNDSDFKGKKLIVKSLELISESSANSAVNVSDNLSIESSGDSEIEVYGNQKIDLKKFVDKSELKKRTN